MKAMEILENDPFLVPAVKHIPTGKVYKGDLGQIHWDVVKQNNVTGEEGTNWRDNPDYQTGFVNHKGHFLNRKRALDYAIENDLLHPNAVRYLASDNAPDELGASFLKK
jgi:hypothetical protein